MLGVTGRAVFQVSRIHSDGVIRRRLLMAMPASALRDRMCFDTGQTHQRLPGLNVATRALLLENAVRSTDRPSLKDAWVVTYTTVADVMKAAAAEVTPTPEEPKPSWWKSLLGFKKAG